ncbi:MAG: serine hydrolase [Hyphobacterium sp.]|nr:MAG: serine hydrolase [Hyphobacterium sp.]
MQFGKTLVVLAAAFLGGLSACSEAAAPSPARAQELGDRTRQIGAVLQGQLDAAVTEGRIPSAIALVARGPNVIWMGTSGDMGPNTPMRTDAIIPLASIGKLYTATAAMILVERAQVSLDDAVSDYIAEFATGAGDGVTIRHLLTHTSGLTVNGNAYWNVWNEHAGHTTTLDMARGIAALPRVREPGTAFEYGGTGGNYEILAAVIEIVSGQTLEAFMVENIFSPLGLNDTYFFIPDEKIDRLPAFYGFEDSELILSRAMGEEYPRNDYFFGGGGISTSAQDALRFAQLFLNDGEVDGVRILETRSVEQMMSDQLSPLPALSNGMGWGFGGAVTRDATPDNRRQYGWIGGSYAMLFVDRTSGLVLYVVTPIEPPGDIDFLMQFQDTMTETLSAGE